jgi:hypothetical protein
MAAEDLLYEEALENNVLSIRRPVLRTIDLVRRGEKCVSGAAAECTIRTLSSKKFSLNWLAGDIRRVIGSELLGGKTHGKET